MKITARQILTALAVFAGVFFTSFSWYGIFHGWVGKNSTFLLGFPTVMGVLSSSIAVCGAGVVAITTLWDKNPTLEFPRKPRLPKATAKVSQ